MQRMFLSATRVSLLIISTVLAFPVSQTCAQITFDFNNNSEFDGSAGVGTTMTATDSLSSDSATITTVDILAPEFDASFALTGNTLSALNGDSVVTSIGSNAIGINNPSINNPNYATIGSGSEEGNDINPGESWVIEFDKDVIITEFNFSSISSLGGESFDVTIEGSSTTNFANAATNDDFVDPFGTTVITAGTNITFTGAGTIADSNVRISEISVVLAGEEEVVLGDVNLNGTVDFLDITPFIELLSSDTFQAEADCDESGIVDFSDITPFINILSSSGS